MIWFAGWLNEVLGAGVIIWAPVAVIGVTAAISVRDREVSIYHIALLLVLVPAASPALATLLGYRFYTPLNMDLQARADLVSAAILLYLLFSAGFLAARPYRFRFGDTHSKGQRDNRFRIHLPYSVTIPILIAMVPAFYYATGGATIITSSYQDIYGNRPFASFTHQALNVFFALFLASAKTPDEKRIRLTVLIFYLLLTLALSARTISLSLIILFVVFFNGARLSLRSLIILGIASAIMLGIGFIRSQGLTAFLTDRSSIPSQLAYMQGATNGGGANIFVGTLGVMDMISGQRGDIFPAFPAFGWLSGKYEMSLYEAQGYAYNGGMHIVSILYWNAGIIGVILGGYLLGRLFIWCNRVLREIDGIAYGTLSASIAIATVLIFPRLLWYHPIGTIKLFAAVFIGYLLLALIKLASGRARTEGAALDCYTRQRRHITLRRNA